MIDHVLVCQCGEVLVKSTGGTTKIRSKILIFRGKQAIAICKGCGMELPAPLLLDETDMLTKSGNPRLFVRKLGT